MDRSAQPERGQRRPALEQRLAQGPFDVTVIGGGVFGVLLAMEGAARGQRVVLLERGDFGGGTSFNSLRTIHGGLRYLQTLDMTRALSSNAQRLWWLRHFPDLVHPISCLMPLYGEGLRRPTTFRLALLLARSLGLGRDANDGPAPSGVMSAEEVRRVAPSVRSDGLQAGAFWTDAFMPQSHRVISECLHWAEDAGAVLANYTEFHKADRARDGGGWRVVVRDAFTGRTGSFMSGKVINAAGSDVDRVAAHLTDGKADVLLVPTLAFNLLLKRPPPSGYSIAAKPPGAGRRTYFVHPFGRNTLAGTGHTGLSEPGEANDGVHEGKLQAMLNDLNEALPGMLFTLEDIQHVFWGVLPGVSAASEELSMRAKIVDHGARHGAANAWSVLGVKFTEAPHVARKTWNAISGPRRVRLPERPAVRHATTAADLRLLTDEELSVEVRSLYDREWCCRADDLIWRRTDLWMDPTLASHVRNLLPHATGAGDQSRLTVGGGEADC